jgi:hypothetical protein
MGGSIDREVAARRQDPRYELLVEAELLLYRRPPRPAMMLDISASGAMLRMEVAHLFVGDEVVLALGSVQSVATIVWIGMDACGLTFHRRLDPFTLDQLRRMTQH